MKKLAGLVVCLVALCSVVYAAPSKTILKDVKGKPAAGVTIYSFLAEHTSGMHYTAQLETSAVTGSDGSYALGELTSLTSKQERFTVAYLPGRLLGWTVEWKEMAGIHLTICRPGPLTVAPVALRYGHVTDRACHPVAGAIIEYLGLVGGGSALPGDILKELHISTSSVADGQGSYVVADVPSNAEPIMVPRKNGFADGRPPGEGRTEDIVLVPGATIDGVVKDTSGRPMGGISVLAYGGPAGGSATTDANGRYVLNDLSPSEWYVRPQKKRMLFAGTRGVMTISGKTTHAADIFQLAVVTVSGKVICADTGKPAPGTMVAITSPNAMNFSEDSFVESGPDGTFTAAAVAGNNVMFVNQVPAGYAVQEPSRQFVVPKAGLSGLTISLAPAELGKR